MIKILFKEKEHKIKKSSFQISATQKESNDKILILLPTPVTKKNIHFRYKRNFINFIKFKKFINSIIIKFYPKRSIE